jgi:ABC-type lipoprotein release transport system permease subunit
MSDGMLRDATARMDRTGLGHVQIHAPGYRKERDIALTVPEPEALAARRRLPPGAAISSRVIVPGLLGTAHGSRGAQIIGVDPTAEAGVALAIRDVVRGAGLEPDDGRGVLVGYKLADRLHLKVGRKVVVTAQALSGDVATSLLQVRGIFRGASPSVAASTAYVTTDTARRLIGAGDVAHEVVIFLPDSKRADAIAASLRRDAGGDLEVLSLGEFLPMMRDLERMMEGFIWALLVVVYILIGLGVLNTMLMSVMERTREFGVLMAVGTPPKQIVTQVLFEAAWIATIAGCAGLLLGLAVNAYGETHGLLDYSAELGEVYEMGGIAFDAHIHSVFSIPRALQATGFVWVLTILFAVYPAWRVTKLRPADAVRDL